MTNDSSTPRLNAELLDRYMAGACTAEDAALVRAALAERPVLGEAVRQIVAPSVPVSAIDTAAAERQLLSRMAAIPAEPVRGRMHAPARTRTAWMRTASLVAAAALVIGGPRVWQRVVAQHDPVVTREYWTRPGERRVVELPDGTQAVLAADTRLRYQAQERGTRTLELVGQAVFRVVAGSDRPFVVRTGHVTTRVLGTRFGVRRYANDTDVRVAVDHGKVASGNGETDVVLTAGTIAVVTDSTAKKIAGGDVAGDLSWVDGQLSFSRTPVPDVLRSLSRWYGYEFRLADTTLATQHVTAAIMIGTPLPKTLQYLKDLLDVTPTVDGTVVTLHRARSTDAKPRPVRCAMPLAAEVGR